MKYAPVTKDTRNNVATFMQQTLPRTGIGNAAWRGFNEILADLTSCEACLAQAEREVERLRQEILGCIRLIPTKFVVRDFSERRTEECIEGTLAISISRLNAELVKCQDAQQLLNSEGRAGT